MAQALANFERQIAELKALHALGLSAMVVRSVASRIQGRASDAQKAYVEGEIKKLAGIGVQDLNLFRLNIYVSICFSWEGYLRSRIGELLEALPTKGKVVADDRKFCGSAIEGIAQVINARKSNHLAAAHDVASLIHAAVALLDDAKPIKAPPIAFTLFLTAGDSKAIERVFGDLKVNMETFWDRIGGDAAFAKAIALSGTARSNGKSAKARLDAFVKERNQVVHGDGLQLVKTDAEIDETFSFFRSFAPAMDKVIEKDALA